MSAIAKKSTRARSLLREFLRQESAAGLILMATAALAMVVAQTPLADAYFAAQHLEVAGLGLLHWINDGLMSLFFLLVGLEIKRELLDGQLATKSRRVLPGAAALGGMLVPALVFLALNASYPETLRGWAIPTATDIAFALGVLALLGPRVPVSLKVFLTALAILDDLGAVVVIALFYTGELSPIWLLMAAAALGVLALLNQLRVVWLPAYLALGVLLWLCVLRSGVHATLAGVALALTIPIRVHLGGPDDPRSPLHRLEHGLHGWVAYLVLPIFGFANAGVSLSGVVPAMLLAPLPLGIALGLLVGKQVGVFLFAWGAIRLGVAELPAHASWPQLYGVALLCGIGFTMSLFIGGLAFAATPALLDATKIGVLAGSLLSALLGWGLLRVVRGEPREAPLAAD